MLQHQPDAVDHQRPSKRLPPIPSYQSPPHTPGHSSSSSAASWSTPSKSKPRDDDEAYLSLSNNEVTHICHYVLQALVPTAASSHDYGSSDRLRARTLEATCTTIVEIPLLQTFIFNALHRTRLPAAIPLSGLVLLRRFAGLYPSASGVPTSAHRMFLASYMVSSKLLQDNSYSNKSWVIVSGGLFTLAEVGMMEKELASFLRWDLRVTRRQLNAFILPILRTLGIADSPPSICRPATPLQQATQPITPETTPDMIPSNASRSIPAPCGRSRRDWHESPTHQRSGWYDDDDDLDDAGPVTPAEADRKGERITAARGAGGCVDSRWPERGHDWMFPGDMLAS